MISIVYLGYLVDREGLHAIPEDAAIVEAPIKLLTFNIGNIGI